MESASKTQAPGETRAPVLWGPGEVVAELGVTRVTFKRWRDAGAFPEPIANLSIGPVWLAAHVRRWADERERDASAARQERIRARAEAVRIYRATGCVIETARQMGAARSTVIAWLEHAGEALPRQ